MASTVETDLSVSFMMDGNMETVRPPKRPPPATSSRAQARLIRQKFFEQEQEEEDREALGITQDELNILQSSVASVKAEFSDLDGLSWDTPWAQEVLMNWQSQQAARHQPCASPGGLRALRAQMRRSLSSIVSPIKEHMSMSTFLTAPLPQGGIAPGAQEDADPFDDDRDRMRPTTPTFPDEDADEDEDVERTPLPSMFRVEHDEGRTPQPQVDDEAQDAEDAELGSEPPTPVPTRPAMPKSLSAPSVRPLPPAFPEAKSNDELAPCQPAKSLPSSRLPKLKTVGRSKSMTTAKTALSGPVSSAPVFTFAATSRPLTSAGEQVATEPVPEAPTQSVLSDSSKLNWRRGSRVAPDTKLSSTKSTDADTVRPHLAPSAKRAMLSATAFSDPALGGAARRPKTARGAKEAKEKEPPRIFGAAARPRSRSSINAMSSNPPAPASKPIDSGAGDVNSPSHIAKEHQDLDVLASGIVNADAPVPPSRAFGQSTRVQTRVRPKGAR